MLGELLSKKLLRDKRGDVSLSGSQHFAAGAPRGEHGNTTLPSASSRRVSLPFTQFPAHLGGPFDTNSALRRTLVKESRLQLGGSSQDFFSRSLPPPWRPLRRAAPPSSTRNPRPRRCAASPSSTRCPTLASSSFISRGPRALSLSYLSTLLPSEPSLLAVFLHSPFVAGFFRAFMRVCTPTNTRKQEKRSSPSVGAI